MLSRRTVAAAMQRLEDCAARVWERPLLCLAAGLLGGSAANAVAHFPAPLVVGVLAAVGLGLLPRWPCVATRRCCRVAFLGLLLTSLHLGWQGLPLPPELDFVQNEGVFRDTAARIVRWQFLPKPSCSEVSDVPFSKH